MAFVYVDTSPKVFTYSGRHTHSTWELILTVEGEGTTRIGDREFPFRPGSIHVVPPRTPHVKQSPTGFKDIYIHMDSLAPYSSCQPFAVEDDGTGTVSALMKNMLYRFLQGNRKDPALAMMSDLVLHLVLEANEQPSADPVIDSVCRYLALHYNDPELSLAQALCATGYQKDYVRRRFRAVCGVTPGEYLTSLRMDKARSLLLRKKEERPPIAEIAAMCGYYDARYFSRVFKKATGSSPESYKSPDLTDGKKNKI